MKRQIKILSEERIAGSDLVRLHKVTLQHGSGKTKEHFIAERIPTVTIFPITEEGEIYLITQHRYILDKVTLEAVAGTVEKEEKPLETAKRELLEEAGIIAHQWEALASVDLAASYVRAKTFLFLAKELTTKEQKLDDDEDIIVVKLPLAEAVQKVLRGEITTASSIIGILWLDRLRREHRL